MKAHFLVSIVAISLTLIARAEPELKGTPSELSQYLQNVPIREAPKSISIAGEAEVRVPADQAVITLKVTTENKSLHEALQLNQEIRGKMIAHLKSNGMAAERVHASKFSSTPRFGLFGEKAKSYKVENLVRITVEDEREFQLTASTVDSFPEVQFVAADFEVKDKEAMRAKAVAQACDNANKRKSMVEEKLGLSLKATGFSSVPVVQTMNSERRLYPSGSYYGGGSFGGYKGLSRSADQTVTSGLRSEPTAGMPDASEDASLSGELVYVVSVMIDYKVEGK